MHYTSLTFSFIQHRLNGSFTWLSCSSLSCLFFGCLSRFSSSGISTILAPAAFVLIATTNLLTHLLSCIFSFHFAHNSIHFAMTLIFCRFSHASHAIRTTNVTQRTFQSIYHKRHPRNFTARVIRENCVCMYVCRYAQT